MELPIVLYSAKNEADVLGIEDLPNELLAKIFHRMEYRDRLRAELVSRRWQKLLREQGWCHFTQCRLKGTMSLEKIGTLFERCGHSLRELIFAPFTASEASLHRDSANQVLCQLHLLHNLKALCICDRRLNNAHLSEIIEKLGAKQDLQCLHFEGCFEEPSHFVWAKLCQLLQMSPCLHYLSLSRAKLFTDNAMVLPQRLRLLELDDSFPFETFLKSAASHCPQLLGLSLNFMRPVRSVGFFFNPLYLELFGRLQHLEISFRKELGEELLTTFMHVFPLMPNLRILCLSRIDGQVLEEVAKHCGQLEQFEYLSHHQNVIQAFHYLHKLKKLRVLCIRHYSGAKLKELSEGMWYTLDAMASNGRLEYLAVNMKMPMGLMLRIVRACPRLSYLESAQPPANLEPLLSLVQQLRDQRNRLVPLRFRISYGQWKKRQQIGIVHTPWFIASHEAPLEETEVIKEHLARVFEGGKVPEFLVRCHPIDYDDGDEYEDERMPSDNEEETMEE